ncbi:MAG: hypothetical protein LBF40_06345, partial [Deltaproteobacteria bacterium]|nr:hypothetical protein [Deltaproteobacteria bacterium]
NYGYRYGPQRVFLGTPGNLNDESRDYNTHLILTSHNESNKPYFPERCKCVQELINETKSVNSNADFEKTLKDIVRSFLDKCETNKEFSWRYYFLKYPKYDGSGLYFWGYTKQSFNQITLSREKRSANSWSTFLWAATVEAGLGEKYEEEDDKLGGIDSPTSETQPLMFKKIKLSLWWDEFSWKIWDIKYKTKNKLRKKQSGYFERLRSKFPKIQENGWLHVKGKDSENYTIDYEDPETNKGYRIYDTQDRIKLIVPIIKFLYKMNSE